MFNFIEGVRRDTNGSFIFDYNNNFPNDIITINSKLLSTDSFGNHLYWFGYQFNPEVSSKVRSEFIDYIKGISPNKIKEKELRKFVIYPMTELNSMINQYHLDTFIYPRSQRSNLVQIMIEEINKFTSRSTERTSYEMVKDLPQNISFNWDMFEADHFGNEQAYKDIKNYVNNTLLPKIHNLDYFSLAKNVKPKYRKYIQNYLNFENEEVKKTFSKLKGENILIVDDVNTSGSTIQEIIRIVNSINTNVNIFIYTLIGN